MGTAFETGELLCAKKLTFQERLTKTSALSEDSRDRLNLSAQLRHLQSCQGFKVDCKDFEVAIKCAPRDAVFFIDAPYLLDKPEGQYAAGDFLLEHHERLAHLLHTSGRAYIFTHQNEARIYALHK